MLLDWVVLTVDVLVPIVELLIVSIVGINLFIKEKHQAIGIFVFVAFVWMSSIATKGASLLLESTPLLIMSELFQLGYMFAIVYLIDVMGRESMDMRKVSIMLILGTAFAALMIVSYYGVELGIVSSEGALLLASVGTIFDALVTLLIGLVWLFFNARIHWNAPNSLKPYSGAALVIAMVTGLGPMILLIIGSLLDTLLTGIPFTATVLMFEAVIVHVTGAVVIGFIWIYKISLLYILPYKAFRLTIIETKGGLPLYTHIWNRREGMADDALFSGMLQGIGMILKETMDKGNVREIILDEATLILQYNEQYSIACMLVTTRSSQWLKRSLAYFVDEFIAEFADHLVSPSEIWRFKSASELVTECFPFVVEY